MKNQIIRYFDDNEVVKQILKKENNIGNLYEM